MGAGAYVAWKKQLPPSLRCTLFASGIFNRCRVPSTTDNTTAPVSTHSFFFLGIQHAPAARDPDHGKVLRSFSHNSTATNMIYYRGLERGQRSRGNRVQKAGSVSGVQGTVRYIRFSVHTNNE